MSTNKDFGDSIREAVPFLRRYARALTGDQTTGDRYAAASVEALLQDRSIAEQSSSAKVGLFKVFHIIWESSGSPMTNKETGLLASAQTRLAALTAGTREALLLSTIEEFNTSIIAEIMQIETSEVEHLLEVANHDMADAVAGQVMIIEDEAMIAMDLESIVSDIGHTVTGVARTHEEAVLLAQETPPDLILADIQLADDSSGVEAVNEILAGQGERPVIFISAFPEGLLTGERPEPAFLIPKPYSEAQVRSAVSQAMFFSSTETLKI